MLLFLTIDPVWMEYLGYSAGALIIISFLFYNTRFLRFINTIGCLLFIIYGTYIQSYPIILSNALIALVNIFYLFFAIVKSDKKVKKTSVNPVIDDETPIIDLKKSTPTTEIEVENGESKEQG